MRVAMDRSVSMWQVITDPDTYDTGVNRGTRNKLKGFSDMIQRFIDANEAGLDAHALSKKIITETRLLSSLVTDTTPESISKQENIQELLNGTNQFVSDRIEQGGDESSTRLVDFLGEVSLATDQDEADTSEERVTLMTVHAAKGLEFSNVIVVGVEDDLFPSMMSKSSLAEIEEERRLLYVAITRAKEHCILTYAGQRYRNGQTMTTIPSPFLRDIDSRYLSRSTGGLNDGYPETVSYRDSFHSTLKHSVTTTCVFRHPDTGASVQPTPSSGNKLTHCAAELSVGMKIEHSRFGRGIITDIDISSPDHKITVRFSNVDTKVLLLKFAKFNIL